jgi:hypothetical protein
MLDKSAGPLQLFGMFWIALAAQISMPIIQGGGIWTLFSGDDVPLSIMREQDVRVVGVRLTVDPTGKLQACSAEFTSGLTKLDEYTCEIIRRRARFQPARGPDGQSAYGIIRTPITWTVNADSPRSPADLELTVSRLPKGIKSPAVARLMFAVDERGHPSSCQQEEPPAPAVPALPPELVKIACAELLQSYVAIPAGDASGRPVASVQDARINFSVARTK